MTLLCFDRLWQPVRKPLIAGKDTALLSVPDHWQSPSIDSADLMYSAVTAPFVFCMPTMVLRAFRNIGHDVNEPLTRVYATPLAQPIHTDSADMVALLSLRLSKEGGLSSWSSSVSVHNELLRLGRKVSLSTHIPCSHFCVIRQACDLAQNLKEL